ncbi:MAG: hypothetical protein QOJ22_295 [Thermoleophilaceae bacterium]|jgi:hypothetical protein|nr:hypothetical protein [Thermoleophilaceae bacterium]
MLLPVLLLLLALALPQTAFAAHAKDLWATVNICDTERSPNVLGVRASMPGNGTKQTMWMRFRASYYDRAIDDWRDVGGASLSPWIEVGDARYRSRQAGRKFKIEPPAPTTSHVVRGVVEYQWRRGKKVIRRRTQKTRSGHPTGRHGDPRGYSAGVCEITFP